MSTNTGEYKSKVGLDSLYIASVTQDDAIAYVAGTPEYLAPAAEASQEPTTSFEVQYADDQPYDVMSADGDTKINLKITGLPPEKLALITGKVWDGTSGRMYDNGGTPPFMALAFRSKKSDGTYRYYQYLKGKFDMPKEAAQTLADKPSPQVLELTYTAIRTVHKFDLGGAVTDSVKRVVGDTASDAFSATNFFAQVQVPGVTAVDALAVSVSDPAAGATNVVITKVITVTFNNKLASGAIKNILLLNGTTDAVIAGTNTVDATGKIVTVGHTGNLPAATPIRIVLAGVKDIFGQDLANAVISFTTA